MTRCAIDSLLREHRAITTTLFAASRLVERASHPSAADFASLRAMLLFIDEFCGRVHHQKESDQVFAKMRARAPRKRRLLDELDRQHQSGERRIRELVQALIRYEMFGAEGHDAFAGAFEAYVCFYLGIMELEEQQLLPVAEQVLTDADWDEFDQAERLRHQHADARWTAALQGLLTRFADRWPREAAQVRPWWQGDSDSSHVGDRPGPRAPRH